MAASILDGDAIARELRSELKSRVEQLKARGCSPCLAMVLAGEDPASLSYIGAKERAAQEAGIECATVRLPVHTSEVELLELVHALNQDERIHGILVQQPLPQQIERVAVVEAVQPCKDVDGLHPYNMGLLLAGRPGFVPCTAAAVVELLLRTGHEPSGKRVAIIGRSNLVGRPLAALLLGHGRGGDATVTVCHSRTPDLASVTQTADILIVAIGRARFVTAEMVRDGAVVIDVGINRLDDPTRRRGYRLAGDVDFESVVRKAGAITPVPGGIGPMTVAMLLENTIRAAELRTCPVPGMPATTFAAE